LSSTLAIKPLYNKLDDCLSADKFRLKRRITQLAQKVNDTSGVEGRKRGRSKYGAIKEGNG